MAQSAHDTPAVACNLAARAAVAWLHAAAQRRAYPAPHHHLRLSCLRSLALLRRKLLLQIAKDGTVWSTCIGPCRSFVEGGVISLVLACESKRANCYPPTHVPIRDFDNGRPLHAVQKGSRLVEACILPKARGGCIALDIFGDSSLSLPRFPCLVRSKPGGSVNVVHWQRRRAINDRDTAKGRSSLPPSSAPLFILFSCEMLF